MLMDQEQRKRRRGGEVLTGSFSSTAGDRKRFLMRGEQDTAPLQTADRSSAPHLVHYSPQVCGITGRKDELLTRGSVLSTSFLAPCFVHQRSPEREQTAAAAAAAVSDPFPAHRLFALKTCGSVELCVHADVHIESRHK